MRPRRSERDHRLPGPHLASPGRSGAGCRGAGWWRCGLWRCGLLQRGLWRCGLLQRGLWRCGLLQRGLWRCSRRQRRWERRPAGELQELRQRRRSRGSPRSSRRCATNSKYLGHDMSFLRLSAPPRSGRSAGMAWLLTDAGTWHPKDTTSARTRAGGRLADRGRQAVGRAGTGRGRRTGRGRPARAGRHGQERGRARRKPPGDSRCGFEPPARGAMLRALHTPCLTCSVLRRRMFDDACSATEAALRETGGVTRDGTRWTRPISPGVRCLPCIRRPPPYGAQDLTCSHACPVAGRDAHLARLAPGRALHGTAAS